MFVRRVYVETVLHEVMTQSKINIHVLVCSAVWLRITVSMKYICFYNDS
jgi:hypothetical protein